MKIRIHYAAVAAALVGTLLVGYACSDETSATGAATTSGSPNGPGGTGGTGGSGATGGTGGSAGQNLMVGGGGSGTGGACASEILEADIKLKPADIIFVIDNSGSMTEEIQAVESNININFAQIIGASMVDYRIIMLTTHGNGSLDVCIGPPLSNTVDCNGPPVENPGLFYHYSVNVQSHDSLCKILNTVYGSMGGGEGDEFGLYPGGWINLLRPEAVKVFVEITDDGIVCTWNGNTYNDQDQLMPGQQVAVAWDQDLLGLAPGQFGTVAQRNYLFYSIVGLPPNPNNMSGAYEEFEPAVLGTCPSAVAPGTGYQWLSKGTEVLRYPMCNTMSYDAIFQDIAAGVVEGTQLPCEFAVPEPPPGQMLDLDSLSVLYTPGDGGPLEEFEKVASLAACGTADDKFYIENDTIYLCPAACDKVTADQMATVQVKVECGFIN
jgi:hypothetical protein